jgi:hypothetical protein
VALNGCAAPDRFAVLRLEVYGSVGLLFPRGVRIQHLLPNGPFRAWRAALASVGIPCIGPAASGIHREARP